MSIRPNSSRPGWFIWLPLGAAVLLTVGLTLGLGLQRQPSPLVEIAVRDQLRPNALGVGSIEEILRYIEAKYVDEVDRNQLVDAAIDDLLAQLDPYSSYVAAEHLDAHQARLAGSARGIGVDVAVYRDSVVIVEVVDGSPAAEVGLQPYDRLISVGDSVVSGRGWSLKRVREQLIAQPGSPVAISAWRRGVGALPPVSLTRKTLFLPTVSPGITLAKSIGYVRIEQFADNTYTEFMEELEALVTERGARDLIIDLRGNTGGYLQEAVKLLSQFFPDAGRLLVYTEGAHAPRVDYKSSGRVLFPVDRVVVLVDGSSASASEIIAGSFQDWDRATIIGRPTYGKGLVQELFPLKDQGALHITVSRYFTPSGRSIQRPYGQAALAALGDPEENDAHSQVETSSTLTQQGPTYATASGRTVYGGGGILPDILVEPSPSSLLDHEPALRRATRNLRFALAEPASALATSKFPVLEQAFVTFAADEGRLLSPSELDLLRPALRRELRDASTSARDAGADRPTSAASLADDPYVVEALRFLRADQTGQ